METKLIEAGGQGNWGRFLLGHYDRQELAQLPRYPGCEGPVPLVSQCGWGSDKVWVMDLATEEGFLVPIGTVAAAHILEKHQVHVCVLFEPFLDWLLGFQREHGAAWWDTLPATVDLPEAPFGFYGYRRPSARPQLTIIMPDGNVEWHWAGGPPRLATPDDQWTFIYHDRAIDARSGKPAGPGWFLHRQDQQHGIFLTEFFDAAPTTAAVYMFTDRQQAPSVGPGTAPR